MANVEHSVLTGTDLHEPKGIAAAAANRVYVSDGAASGSWTTVPAAAISAAGVLVFQGQFYNIVASFSTGTNGGALGLNTWNTREINTELTDDLGITTSSNQMSLVAGTYYVEVDAATNFEGTSNSSIKLFTSKLRLRNVTDSTTLVVGLGSRFSNNDSAGGNSETEDITLMTHLSGRFTIGGTKLVEIQNWCTSELISPTTRGGKAISSGENEIYLNLKLWKLA